MCVYLEDLRGMKLVYELPWTEIYTHRCLWIDWRVCGLFGELTEFFPSILYACVFFVVKYNAK